SRKCSRRNWTRSVRESTSAVTALPFTVMDTAGMAFLLGLGRTPGFSHRILDPAGKTTRNRRVFAHFAVWNKSHLNLDRKRGQGRRLIDAGAVISRPRQTW